MIILKNYSEKVSTLSLKRPSLVPLFHSLLYSALCGRQIKFSPLLKYEGSDI